MEDSKYKRPAFLGIILIALGVTMNTTLDLGYIGTVMIALGGFFLIVAMAKKKAQTTNPEKDLKE